MVKKSVPFLSVLICLYMGHVIWAKINEAQSGWLSCIKADGYCTKKNECPNPINTGSCPLDYMCCKVSAGADTRNTGVRGLQSRLERETRLSVKPVKEQDGPNKVPEDRQGDNAKLLKERQTEKHMPLKKKKGVKNSGGEVKRDGKKGHRLRMKKSRKEGVEKQRKTEGMKRPDFKKNEKKKVKKKTKGDAADIFQRNSDKENEDKPAKKPFSAKSGRGRGKSKLGKHDKEPQKPNSKKSAKKGKKSGHAKPVTRKEHKVRPAKRGRKGSKKRQNKKKGDARHGKKSRKHSGKKLGKRKGYTVKSRKKSRGKNKGKEGKDRKKNKGRKRTAKGKYKQNEKQNLKKKFKIGKASKKTEMLNTPDGSEKQKRKDNSKEAKKSKEGIGENSVQKIVNPVPEAICNLAGGICEERDTCKRKQLALCTGIARLCCKLNCKNKENRKCKKKKGKCKVVCDVGEREIKKGCKLKKCKCCAPRKAQKECAIKECALGVGTCVATREECQGTIQKGDECKLKEKSKFKRNCFCCFPKILIASAVSTTLNAAPTSEALDLTSKAPTAFPPIVIDSLIPSITAVPFTPVSHTSGPSSAKPDGSQSSLMHPSPGQNPTIQAAQLTSPRFPPVTSSANSEATISDVPSDVMSPSLQSSSVSSTHITSFGLSTIGPVPTLLSTTKITTVSYQTSKLQPPATPGAMMRSTSHSQPVQTTISQYTVNSAMNDASVPLTAPPPILISTSEQQSTLQATSQPNAKHSTELLTLSNDTSALSLSEPSKTATAPSFSPQTSESKRPTTSVTSPTSSKASYMSASNSASADPTLTSEFVDLTSKAPTAFPTVATRPLIPPINVVLSTPVSHTSGHSSANPDASQFSVMQPSPGQSPTTQAAHLTSSKLPPKTSSVQSETRIPDEPSVVVTPLQNSSVPSTHTASFRLSTLEPIPSSLSTTKITRVSSQTSKLQPPATSGVMMRSTTDSQPEQTTLSISTVNSTMNDTSVLLTSPSSTLISTTAQLSTVQATSQQSAKQSSELMTSEETTSVPFLSTPSTAAYSPSFSTQTSERKLSTTSVTSPTASHKTASFSPSADSTLTPPSLLCANSSTTEIYKIRTKVEVRIVYSITLYEEVVNLDSQMTNISSAIDDALATGHGKRRKRGLGSWLRGLWERIKKVGDGIVEVVEYIEEGVIEFLEKCDLRRRRFIEEANAPNITAVLEEIKVLQIDCSLFIDGVRNGSITVDEDIKHNASSSHLHISATVKRIRTTIKETVSSINAIDKVLTDRGITNLQPVPTVPSSLSL